MPPETTSRAARPSTSVQSTDDLRNRIQTVSKELHQIESEVRKDAENLERVRQLLDVSYLNELLGLIDELEVRITESTEAAKSAETDKDRFRAKFEEEQERLEKLWDAYKGQERELTTLREKVPRLEAELGAKDGTMAEVESALTAKDEEARRLQASVAELQRNVADLEAEKESLKEVAAFRDRAAELERKLEEEKERLAKLYVVYEELEAERDDLLRQLQERDAWFQQAKPHLEALGRTVPRRAAMTPPPPKRGE